MRAAVEQILALEIEPAVAEVAAAGERSRAAGVGREQVVELGSEGRVLFGVEERGLKLFERGQQDFGDVAAAEAAETAV